MIDYELNDDEKLWLEEIYKFDFEQTDTKEIMIKLSRLLTNEFDPSKISYLLCRPDRLTLLGIQLIDPKSDYLRSCEIVLIEIIKKINNNPKLDKISATDLVIGTGLNLRKIEISLLLLSDFQIFDGGGGRSNKIGFEHISIPKDTYALKKLLRFKDITSTLAEYGTDLLNSPNKIKKPVNKKLKFENDSKILWDQIEKEYRISKRTFGKKINFVNNKQKRLIIFRDVEQAYLLSKNGFSKPAIILSGSVIEELLRLYLDSKGIKSNRKTFDDYIKICEENKYLTKAVRLLSDSVRHFRNFVHLEQETDFKKSITPSMAQGAVASIFTVVNEF